MLRLFIFTFILLGSSQLLHAQKINKEDYKRLSVDIYAGLPLFFGDVQHEFKSFNTTGHLNYTLTSALSLGGEFSFGQLQGSDEDIRGDYFKSQYLKTMLGGEVYLLNLLRFTELGTKFQPYFGLNIGAIQTKVLKAGSKAGPDLDLHNGWSFANQWHLGAKIKLSQLIDLNLRSCLLLTKTDLLDNQDAAVPNNKSNDALVNLELGLSFHLGKKQKKALIWKSPEDNQLDSLLNEAQTLSDSNSIEQNLESLQAKMLQNEAINQSKVEELEAENEALKEQVIVLTEHLNELIDYVVDHVESVENKIQQKEDKIIVDVKPPTKKPAEKTKENNSQTKKPTSSNTSLYTTELVGPISAKYYIISGSFTELSNAEKRIQTLTTLGYTPVIMRDPKANNSNRVVVDTADDYQLAKELLLKYHNELDPEAWIIKQQD